MSLLVQLSFFLSERGGDNALYSFEVPRSVAPWETDFQGTCQKNNKVEKIISSLIRLMSNLEGLTEKKRKLLANIAISVLL